MIEETCNICKDPIHISQKTPCNHKFCLFCIKKHLNKRNFCPSCLYFPLHVSELSDTTQDKQYKSKSNIKKKLESSERRLITFFAVKSDSNKSELELENKEKSFDVTKKITDTRSNAFSSIKKANKPILFGRMTDEKLRKECKRRGLLCRTRNEMVNGLKEFDLIYEIEIRSENPLSMASISQMVNGNSLLMNKDKVSIDVFITQNMKAILETRDKILLENKIIIHR